MTHDDNHHCEFHKTYVRLSESVYICHMSKRLRRYIHHCKSCLKNQTTRHSLYDELNLMKTMTLLFYTIIIDFIVALFASQDYDALLTTTNKFFKKVNLITEKTNWNVFEWILIWLNALQKEKWKLSKVIISNRDFKFVNAFWKAIFLHHEVFLHFTTTYHFSSDNQFERTNQIVKIVIKYVLMKEKNLIKILSFKQESLNNFKNAFTDLSSNEIIYEFKIRESINILIHANDDNLSTAIKNERDILKKKQKKSTLSSMRAWKYDMTRQKN